MEVSNVLVGVDAAWSPQQCQRVLTRRQEFSHPRNIFLVMTIFLINLTLYIWTWGLRHHPTTYDGKRFFLTIVNGCTRFDQHKFDAPTFIKNFFSFVIPNFCRTMKQLKYENVKIIKL